MKKEKIKKLEEKANELFGEKSLVSVATVKFADKGYMVRIKMQGMPFEISALRDTLEEAEELAYSEFEKQMTIALDDSLFTTQPLENYKERKLSDQEFERLFKHEELLGDDYINELKEKTVVKICQLEDGRYECVLESPYMCLHARGVCTNEKFAIFFATNVAHDVFRATLKYVGKEPWRK